MKDVFYGLLSFIIIATFLFYLKNTPICEFPEELNGVIIEMESDFLTGKTVTVKTDSTIKTFVCYDILFNELNVGDTIK